ncbi:MAG: hypothetical protein LBL30_00870 [Holosporales bacterium]|jgi:putative transferase (TIGR04331 family)|nr:hypothetical protein [Holosporales bacterium]
MDAKTLHITRIDNIDTFDVKNDAILMPVCIANAALLEKYPELMDLNFKDPFPTEDQRESIYQRIIRFSEDKCRDLRDRIAGKCSVSYPEHILNFIYGYSIFSLTIEVTYRYHAIKDQLKDLEGDHFIVNTVNADFPRRYTQNYQYFNNLTGSLGYQEWLTAAILEHVNDPRIKIVRSRSWNPVPEDYLQTSFTERLCGLLKSSSTWKKPWRIAYFATDEAWKTLPKKYKLFDQIRSMDSIMSVAFSLVLFIKSLCKTTHKFVVPADTKALAIPSNDAFDEVKPLVNEILDRVFDFERIVDDFHAKIQANIKNLPKRTSDIFNRTSFANDDLAFYQAAAMLAGHRLFFVQHGSDYATLKRHPTGKIIEDRGTGFVFAGHTKHPNYKSHTISMPSAFFSRYIHKKLPKYDDLVFVTTVFYQEMECVSTRRGDVFHALKDGASFINELSEEIRPHLIFRDHANYRAWCPYFSHTEYLKRRIKDLRFLDEGVDVSKRMLGSKLIVSNYTSTFWYEAMATNVPMITYPIDYGYNGLVPEVEEFYGRLKKAGIMHGNYKSALNKVHEIWPDVDSWWRSKEIQQLRDEFCYRYAWPSKIWRRDWLKFLWNL